MKRLSFKAWLSIVSAVLVVLLLFLSRKELLHAWELLGQVDLWILALILPLTVLSYLSSGAMIFSYLRHQGVAKNVGPATFTRLSIELNFVNHVLPSGGVSGVSYMNWRLGQFGVSGGRATMAQMVRYVAGFAALIALLALSVILVTIDGNINRWTILTSGMLVVMMVALTVGGVYMLSSPHRTHMFADWFTMKANRFIRKVTFGKRHRFVRSVRIKEFFDEMHDDYKEISKDRRLLLKPFMWGLSYTLAEVGIFAVVFWALGSAVNPAPILIAYGIATMAGLVVVTPGGAGAYETIMVLVLSMSGMAQGEAIAGVLLARIIILLLTVSVGYVLYQLAIVKHGKRTSSPL